MIEFNSVSDRPVTNTWKISTISLIIFSFILMVLAGWLLINYMDQKTDVDTKISIAVNTAVKQQADDDTTKFNEREKDPNREFAGPDDYGQVTFNYPKTWSVYIDKDVTNGGTYEAYFNPVSVPPISNDQQFALRVTIEEKDYSDVLASYNSLVKKGSLNSSGVTATNGATGTRLDGVFSKDIRGCAVIFKIRDKTLTIRTDASAFKSDFDSLIGTINFNQ